MRLSTNRKIVIAGAAILLIAYLISLTPWYHAYMARDHRWTCAKLRKAIEWNYDGTLQDAADGTYAGSQEATLDALRRTNSRIDYDLVAAADKAAGVRYEMDGICRDGGTFLFVFDESGNLSVRCSASGHNVDYTELTEQ